MERAKGRGERAADRLSRADRARRRGTRVIRVFTNEASLLRLTAALTEERTDTWLGRCYLASLAAHAEVLTRTT